MLMRLIDGGVMAKNYWIAQLNGGDSNLLKAAGFLVPPMEIDGGYIFLEACESNKHFLREQEANGIRFLKDQATRRWAETPQTQVTRMINVMLSKFQAGCKIKVLRGCASGLSGEVISVDADSGQVTVAVKGWRRVFVLKVDTTDLTVI